MKHLIALAFSSYLFFSAAAQATETTIHEEINSVDLSYLQWLGYMESIGYIDELVDMGYYVPDPIPFVGIEDVGAYREYLDSFVGLGYLNSFDRADTSWYFGANGTSHLTVDFHACESNGDMEFRIGTDAGFGFEAYLDDVLVTGAYEDVWWDYNWYNPGVRSFIVTPTEGMHRLDIYTVEGCCGGGSVLEYRHDWTDWTPFVAGVDACPADADDDGIPDSFDNCPSDANEDQADADDDGVGNVCEADTDADGVVDDDDLCPDTAADVGVNADGCSIDQLNPCNGAWKNHGAYVSAVTATARSFLSAGAISQSEYGDIVSAAARSSCGKK